MELSSETKEPPVNPSQVMESLLDTVGSFGKWQWMIWLIASFAGLFTTFNNVSAAFLAATPEHWCMHPNLTNSSIQDFIDKVEENSSHTWFPQCEFYDIDYDELIHKYWLTGQSPEEDDIPGKKCQKWYYDTSEFHSTISTEWDLVCDKRWLMSTVQSFSVFGFLVGGIVFSELSDMYGRRTLALISTVGFLVTGVSVAFSNSYELLISLRFILGACAAGIALPNFVIIMECCGEKGRTYLGIIYQLISGVGISLLAGIAYFFSNWRSLQLFLYTPSAVMLLYFKILPESPRWLLDHGRKEEATKLLKDIAKGNNKEVDEERLQKLLSSYEQAERKPSNIFKMIGLFFTNQIKLFRTPILRRRCILIFFGWFVVGLVYYGLVFNSPNLNASRFALVAISGITEVVSVSVIAWTTQKLGRKLILLGTFFTCGISCICILFVPKDMVWLNITLSTIGKFANAAAFAVVYIYSAELVPTSVRNIAVGASSMWARIGSMSAPYIVDLLGDVHYAIPSTAFGVLSFAGGLAALLLPETGGRNLPNSIEEIEALER